MTDPYGRYENAFQIAFPKHRVSRRQIFAAFYNGSRGTPDAPTFKLAIAAATLLSTWYPARTAMEIAKPADNASWSLPAPDADGHLSTLLPFTFTHHDRIAILAFLHDYFDSLGEGSSGIFFSGRPELRVSDRLDDLADGTYIPELKVRVWLKPFDLGVSQDVEIELGTDPETRKSPSCLQRPARF